MTTDGSSRQSLAAIEDVCDGGFGFTYGSGPLAPGAILVRMAAGLRGGVNRCRHLAVPPITTTPGRSSTGVGSRLVRSVHGALFRADEDMCVAGPCRGAQLHPIAIVIDGGRALSDLGPETGSTADPGRDP